MTVSLTFTDTNLSQDLPKDKLCWDEFIDKELENTHRTITSLKLEDEQLDIVSTATLIKLSQAHAATLRKVHVRRCAGALDMFLATVLVSQNNVQSFSLCFARRPEGHLILRYFQIIGLALRVNPNIQEMDIRLSYPFRQTFPLSVESAQAFAQGLANNTTLKTLIFQQCGFGGPSAVEALCQGFKNNKGLESIDFFKLGSASGDPLDDASLSMLIRSFSTCSQLQKVRIAECQYLSQSLAATVALLDQGTLEDLRIVNPIFGDDGERMDLAILVSALGRNSSLQTLEMYNCGLRDESMAYIAAALEYNTGLKRVEMAFNEITSIGVSILASKAKSWKSLEHLDLYACEGDKGIGQALQLWETVLQSNHVLSQLLLETHLYKRHPLILYYLRLNGAGRRLLHICSRESASLPSGIWPHLFAKANQKAEPNADAIYYFLKELPHIVIPSNPCGAADVNGG